MKFFVLFTCIIFGPSIRAEYSSTKHFVNDLGEKIWHFEDHCPKSGKSAESILESCVGPNRSTVLTNPEQLEEYLWLNEAIQIRSEALQESARGLDLLKLQLTGIRTEKGDELLKRMKDNLLVLGSIEHALEKHRLDPKKSSPDAVEKLKLAKTAILNESPILGHEKLWKWVHKMKYMDLPAGALDAMGEFYKDPLGYRKKTLEELDPILQQGFEKALKDEVIPDVEAEIYKRLYHYRRFSEAQPSDLHEFLNDRQLIEELVLTVDPARQKGKEDLSAAGCRFKNRILKDDAMNVLKGLAVNSVLTLAGIGVSGALVKSITAGKTALSAAGNASIWLSLQWQMVFQDIGDVQMAGEKCEALKLQLMAAPRGGEFDSDPAVTAHKLEECWKQRNDLIAMAAVGTVGGIAADLAPVAKLLRQRKAFQKLHGEKWVAELQKLGLDRANAEALMKNISTQKDADAVLVQVNAAKKEYDDFCKQFDEIKPRVSLKLWTIDGKTVKHQIVSNVIDFNPKVKEMYAIQVKGNPNLIFGEFLSLNEKKGKIYLKFRTEDYREISVRADTLAGFAKDTPEDQALRKAIAAYEEAKALAALKARKAPKGKPKTEEPDEPEAPEDPRWDNTGSSSEVKKLVKKLRYKKFSPLSKGEAIQVVGSKHSSKALSDRILNDLEKADASFKELGFTVPPQTKVFLGDKKSITGGGNFIIDIPMASVHDGVAAQPMFIQNGFGSARGESWNSTSVLIHERTHQIMNATYAHTNFVNTDKVVNEALSDFTSAHMLDDPRISKDSWKVDGSYVRTQLRNVAYPGDPDSFSSIRTLLDVADGHTASQFMSNALWKIRTAIGKDKMSKIYLKLIDEINNQRDSYETIVKSKHRIPEESFGAQRFIYNLEYFLASMHKTAEKLEDKNQIQKLLRDYAQELGLSGDRIASISSDLKSTNVRIIPYSDDSRRIEEAHKLAAKTRNQDRAKAALVAVPVVVGGAVYFVYRRAEDTE